MFAPSLAGSTLNIVIVFDLDGCLIDSEKLIRQSYRDAGADAPGDFLTLGHHEWIVHADREAIHRRKNAAYLRRLATGPLALLPPWRVAEMLNEAGHVVALLTNAPEGVIRVLAEHAPSWPFMTTCAAVSPAGKTAWLACRGKTGVYVDDQEYVKMPGGWRFVHYKGQDASELYQQITCP